MTTPPHGGEEHSVNITTEVADAPWNPQHRLVHIGIRAKDFNDATKDTGKNLSGWLKVPPC